MAGTATRFKAAGFTVCVAVLAVPQQLSRLSAEERFLCAQPDDARWTPPTAHDRSYEAIPSVLEVLEKHPAIDTIAIYTRTGKTYSNARDSNTGEWIESPAAVENLHDERSRPLTTTQAREWLSIYDSVLNHAARRPGYTTGERVAPIYHSLNADAETIR